MNSIETAVTLNLDLLKSKVLTVKKDAHDVNVTECCDEILSNLAINKEEKNNVAKSHMKSDIEHMLIRLLPSKFDYVRYSVKEKVFDLLKQDGITLY